MAGRAVRDELKFFAAAVVVTFIVWQALELLLKAWPAQ